MHQSRTVFKTPPFRGVYFNQDDPSISDDTVELETRLDDWSFDSATREFGAVDREYEMFQERLDFKRFKKLTTINNQNNSNDNHHTLSNGQIPALPDPEPQGKAPMPPSVPDTSKRPLQPDAAKDPTARSNHNRAPLPPTKPTLKPGKHSSGGG